MHSIRGEEWTCWGTRTRSAHLRLVDLNDEGEAASARGVRVELVEHHARSPKRAAARYGELNLNIAYLHDEGAIPGESIWSDKAPAAPRVALLAVAVSLPCRTSDEMRQRERRCARCVCMCSGCVPVCGMRVRARAV